MEELAHASERLWRNYPWTPGIYQYVDQRDLTIIIQAKAAGVQLRGAGPPEVGRDGQEGLGLAASRGQGKRKSLDQRQGKSNSQLALKDKEKDDEEEQEEEEEEEQTEKAWTPLPWERQKEGICWPGFPTIWMWQSKQPTMPRV